MKIDIDNYEEFALDYLEGALDEKQSHAFEAFLSTNPKLAKSLETLMDFKLQPDVAIVFEDKKALIQNRKSKAWMMGLLALLLGIAGAGLWFILAVNGNENKTANVESTSFKSKIEVTAGKVPSKAIEGSNMPLPSTKHESALGNGLDQNASANSTNIPQPSVPLPSLPNAILPEEEYESEMSVNDMPPTYSPTTPTTPQAEPTISQNKAPETATDAPSPIESKIPKSVPKESVRVVKTSPLPQTQKSKKKNNIWNGLKEAFMPEAEEEESPKSRKTQREGLPKIKINWKIDN